MARASRSLRTMPRPDIPYEIALVAGLCRTIGLGEVAPVLLKAAHHTSLLIRPHGMVARVQSAEPVAVAWRRAANELAVARHLAHRRAPALAPCREWDDPHIVASSVVTFWPYVERARAADEGDGMLAVTTLASVHAALLGYGGALPPYTRALDRCRSALARASASTGLSVDDKMLLERHLRRLRDDVQRASAAWAPLHGDVHLGNLLIGPEGPRWIDFEDVCRGPREYDVAGLPSELWSRFPDADPALVATFADLKSVCVAIWCSADRSRSAEISEAATYHLDRIRRWDV